MIASIYRSFSVAAVLLAATTSAHAALVIDVRAAGAEDAKNITVAAGDVVTLNVYATVTGSNAAADDGFQSFFASFASSLTNGGAAIGDFSTFTAASPFTATTQAGRIQDLNGQPGLDVGSPDQGTQVSADYVQARASAMQIGNGANPEFFVGSLTWTVTATPGTGTTTLNVDPRENANGTPAFTAAIWREDGINKNPTSAGTSYLAGAPVNVAVPEPTTLAALSLAGLTMARRRRSV